MYCRNTAYGFFILLVALVTSPAFADEHCTKIPYQQNSYFDMLQTQHSLQCFEVENNTTTLGVEVDKLLQATTPDARTRALQALSLIQDHLTQQFIERNTSQAANATQVQIALQELKQSIIDNTENPEARIKEDYKLDNIAPLPAKFDAVDFETILSRAECSRVDSKNCDADYEFIVDIVNSIMLANVALDIYSENFRSETLKAAQNRRSKWDSYYDDLTFQYPWELWANNFVLEAGDERASIDGNKVGFRQLPKSKIVLLHPDVNLVYADQAEDEYEVTVTIEMLGYEGFGFDKNGKVEDAWGVSLLAAYLDRVDRAESGWTAGLLFKYDGYSVGFTDNHGETGVVFNVNLSQRLFDVKQEARNYHDEYKDEWEQLKRTLEQEMSN